MTSTFLRKCKIEFYDKNNRLRTTIYGASHLNDNQRYQPKVYFEVEKDKSSKLTKAHIKIYNLSEETENDLQQFEKIKLYAGYKNDFENENDLHPFFTGNIYNVEHQGYKEAETNIYCYSGVDITTKHMPIVSLDGPITFKMLFRGIRDGFIANGYQFGLCNDLTLSKVIDGYDTLIFSQNGYTIRPDLLVKDFFNQIVKSLSSKKQVKWYFDDNKQTIMLYNKKGEFNQSNAIILIDGVDIIAYDSAGRERRFREKSFKEALDTKRRVRRRSLDALNNMEDMLFINISTIMNKGINLDNDIIISANNHKKKYSILTMSYTGNTHGRGDEWKIAIRLKAYE